MSELARAVMTAWINGYGRGGGSGATALQAWRASTDRDRLWSLVGADKVAEVEQLFEAGDASAPPCSADAIVSAWLAGEFPTEREAAVKALEAAGEWSGERPLAERIAALAAERDRRIDPVEHARSVLGAFEAGVLDDVEPEGPMPNIRQMRRIYAEASGLLARVGPEVLAEVER